MPSPFFVTKFMKLFFTLVVLTLFNACSSSGSGESTTTPPPPALIAQTLEFSQKGPLNLQVGDVLENRAAGQGSGALVYSSSNPDIANVDEKGVVHIISGGEGSVVITAQIAADSRYLGATSSYIISVPPDAVGFVGWVGPNDTILEFSKSAIGYEFYHSPENDCDLNSLDTCLTAQHDVINVNQIVDTSVTLSRAGSYLLKDKNRVASARININAKIPAKIISDVVSLKDEMYVLTAQKYHSNHTQEHPDQFINSIYSSSDGIEWKLRTSQPAFSYRDRATLVSFHDQLWIVGGQQYNLPIKDDVWVSDDGTKWVEKVQETPFPYSINHNIIVFDDQLWLIDAGTHDQAPSNLEVWTSQDGVNWNFRGREETAMCFASCIVFKEKIWSIKGDEVSSSVDGVNWKLETTNIPLTEFQVFDNGFVVFNNKLWVFPADDSDSENRIFVSNDGFEWKKIYTNTLFGKAKPIVHNSQLWLALNNTQEDTSISNPLFTSWSSPDGIDWIYRGVDANFNPRGQSERSVLNLNGTLLLIDKYTGGPQFTWQSKDGLNWEKDQVIAQEFAKLTGQFVYYKDRLWNFELDKHRTMVSGDGITWKAHENPYAAFGGGRILNFKGKLLQFTSGKNNNGILSSDDGFSWTTIANTTPIPHRDFPIIKALANKLIIFGGVNYDAPSGVSLLNDAWESRDGVNWSEVTSYGTSFSPIYEPNSRGIYFLSPDQLDDLVVVFKNKLWFISSILRETTGYENQLWVSEDGANWTKGSKLPFSGRSQFKPLVIDDELWVIGGVNTTFPNDVDWSTTNEVWRTKDGLEWRQGYRGLLEFNLGAQ